MGMYSLIGLYINFQIVSKMRLCQRFDTSSKSYCY